VYAAEQQGINLALNMIQTSIRTGDEHKKVTVFMDNQSAIRSFIRPEGRSGTYTIKQIIHKTGQLQTERVAVSIRWI
jgi:hypothetical protein